ncbi:unnamed protein product [Fructobacillus tropaeoli]|uniref:Secreted protein n=1 Tax=Fructobacillus tropaeoli TaxID=709323 RepID=A0ABM9MXP6_9LACO|nr:unnamed protein product [Fructobacillus tropaeoli]CAK1247618.1 unnamed protein product [Fructobacillus tropaeoli]
MSSLIRLVVICIKYVFKHLTDSFFGRHTDNFRVQLHVTNLVQKEVNCYEQWQCGNITIHQNATGPKHRRPNGSNRRNKSV